MGTLKSLTILLTLGAWATATDGAPPDDAPPASPPASRQQPPAHPSKYLDAAQALAKKGDARAADYARAADSYRDMLTAADQTKLDALLAQLAPAPAAKADPAVAPTAGAPADAPPNLGDAQPASADATVRDRARQLVAQSRQALANGHADEARKLATEADALGAAFSGEDDHPKKLLAEIDRPRTGGGLGSRGTAPTDGKQQGRWLLQSAREQVILGRYDEAAAKLAEARALNLHWGLFEDSPTRVADYLEKARPKVAAKGAKGDRRQADAKLREARGLIAAGQPQQAEAVALEVAAWNLRWGMMGDNPTKVAQAARAIRRRDASRDLKPRNQPSEANYNNLVASSRELLRTGKLDEADARARQALSMNVTPALTADRAEAVLTDIDTARQARQPIAPALEVAVAADNAPTDPSVSAAATTTQVPEPASVAAERTANQLLASGEKEAAAVKLVEAQTLKTQEDAATTAAPIAAPAGAPVPDLSAAPPSLGDTPATTAPATAGGAALDQAKNLLANGKYPEARQYANQAKAAGAGPEADQVLAQVSGTEQAAAVQIYESVLASIRKGTEADMSHARGLLGELQGLELDESTKQKVEDLLMKLPKEGAGRATVGMNAIEDKETVEAMKLSAEVGTKIAESKHLMETDPEKAIALLAATIDQVKAAGCKETVTRTMTRRIEANIELAKKDKVLFDQKMKDKVFKGEIENKRLRILEADKAKKDRMKVLMGKAETAMSNGEFDVAEKLYAQAAEIDPNEVAARAGRYVAQARRYYTRDVDNKRQKENAAVGLFQDVDASAITPAGLLSGGSIDMPETFRDLSAKRRDLAQRTAPRKSPQILETEKALNKPITINLDQTTLAEAIKYLGEMTGLNIITDGKALAEEAVTLKSPVSMHASGIKLKSVLKYMLKDLNLNYDIDEEGVLVITSAQMNQKRTYPLAYYVGDLVMPVNQQPKGANGMPLIPGMQVDPNNLQNQAAAMNGAASAFEAPHGPAMKPQRDNRDADFDPLVAMIKTAVAPGTWSNNHSPADVGMSSYGQGGGGAAAGAGDENAVGTITPFFLSISLIIRHTAEVHDDVVDLLRQLRRLQDLQVSIEVRFITVSDSFFEQIGVDFDFSIHSDVVGPKSSFAIPNPAAALGGGTAGGGGATVAANPFLINPVRDHTQGNKAPLIVGAQGANGNTNPGNFTPNLQLPFTQNSASLITPFNALAGSNAATFGIAFLSDLEVYLFLSAIQGDTRSNLVQAPKVTSFNGAPASVVNITQRNYVAQLTPVAAAGAIAFAPTIGQIPDGVTLFVTPVVSADRRYVRMTLSPNFITFISFDTFNVPAAVGGGGLGGQASAITAQIQLPVLSITNVQTTVTVPDGGTVLLGGVKRLREERREFGVPILSKTPLIDRLFRNIGIGRTTDSLMLMVTPRIIILEEEEEKLGIPSVQNITF